MVGLTLLRGGETSSHIWAPSPQPGFALVKMCGQRLNARLSHSSESVKTWSANQDTQMFGKQDGEVGDDERRVGNQRLDGETLC